MKKPSIKKPEWKLMYFIVLAMVATTGLAMLLTVGILLLLQGTVVAAIVFQAFQSVTNRLAGELEYYDSLPWLLDYWQEHWDEMNLDPTQLHDKSSAMYQARQEYLFQNPMEVTSEQAAGFSEEYQKLFAEYCYISIVGYFHTDQSSLIRVSSICIRPEENRGFVFFSDGMPEPYDKAPGYLPVSSPELMEAIRKASEIPGSEGEAGNLIWVNDEDWDATGVIRPIMGEDGPLCYIISGFQTEEMAEIIKVAFLLVGVPVLALMIACDIVILAFVYSKAIRPTEILQKVVRSYSGTKDSKGLKNGLARIRKKKDEYGRLSAEISEMADSIDNYVEEVEKAATEKQRLSTELETAQTIQKNQLPGVFPAFPERKEFELYASMDPAKEVGGDFYDFFLIDEDHLALAVGDVSDKGIPAALVMMVTRSLIRSTLLQGMTPSAAMEHVNRQICETNGAEMFVTVWLSVIELSTGTGIEINAGHEKPVLKRAGGSFALIRNPHDMALGTFEEQTFEEHPLQLHPGDALFVYSDGVPEATSKDQELFGTERMLSALNEDPDRSPKEQIENMKKEIERFTKEADQFDDITMLAFVYREQDE